MENKIALTIDIEDWFHSPAISGSDFSFFPDVKSFMQKFSGNYDYITKSTLRVLEILNNYNLKATFFIVADIPEYYPGLIESICKNGHEIACHGLHHAMNLKTKSKEPAFSKVEFEERTGLAKDILIKSTGQDIIGYRAPGAYIGEWMFDSLIKLKFKYDSSVTPNSLYNKTDFSLSEISSKPYIIKREKDTLLEIPWSYFKILSFRFPTSGGPFLRFFPVSYIKHGLKKSLTRGDTVFYFHTLDVAKAKLPGLASKNKKRPFFYYTSGIRTEKKLINIIDTYKNSFSTCENILNKYNL